MGSRNANLDAVRGIAILLVLLFHFYLPTGLALDRVVMPVARTGWAGVDLFFVLSGFLVGRLILVEAARGAGFDYRRFFVRRALRLWPALYAYLAALLLLCGPDGWSQVWPVLLHVQNYSYASPNHLWSLAVEQHFYLVAALLLPMLAGWGTRYVVAGLGAVVLACPLLRLVALANGAALLEIQWHTPYRLDAMALGVLLACCAVHRPDWLARAGAYRAALLAAAAAGFAALAIGNAEGFRHGIGFSIAACASAALIVAVHDVRLPGPLAPLAAMLGALGAISYSLYLWHASLGRVAEAALLSAGWTHPLAILGGKLALAIGISLAMYRLVERPLMQWRGGAGARGYAVPGTATVARGASISTTAH